MRTMKYTTATSIFLPLNVVVVSLIWISAASVSPGATKPDSSTSSLQRIVTGDASAIWKDGAKVITAPLRFSKSDWLLTGAVAGGTVVLFSIDASGRSIALRNQSAFGGDLASVGREYGRVQNALLLSGGIYGAGLIAGNREVRTTGLIVFESLAFAGITTTILKTVLGRARPYLDEGNRSFHLISFDEDRYSMPSGHATVAFAVSSSLAGRIDNIWASIGLYSLATVTAVSRVYDDEHWISDSVLGATIGTAVGIGVVRLHREDDPSTPQLQILPSPGGIQLQYVFR